MASVRRKSLWAAGAAAAVFGGYRLLVGRRAIDLAGRVALVTGGSRGLGLLIARELARQGCLVAVCARDLEELDRARYDLEGRHFTVEAIPCDVRDREAVLGMVDRVIQRFGRIDLVINNAGTAHLDPIEALDVHDFREAMATNFFGVVHTTLAALPYMRERRFGRIVNVTSIGGKVALPQLLPYDCAKFAALGFSEGMHAELMKDNILVTTVVPGLLRTGSSRLGASPLLAMSARRAAQRIVEAARRGEPELTLTWQARALRLVHALLPGMTVDLLGAVHRLLPPPRPSLPSET